MGNLYLPQCQHQKLNQTESHLNQIETTKANLEHDEQYANRIYNISRIANPEAPIGELRAYHNENKHMLFLTNSVRISEFFINVDDPLNFDKKSLDVQ